MAGFTKLFSTIVTSSIWSEDDKTRILWVTMLALANENGQVEAALPGLAKVAGMSIEDCAKSLAKLESPDPYSRTPDHDGRRVVAVDGGWVLINHAKYRGNTGRNLSADPHAVRSREWMRQKRAQQAPQGDSVASTSRQHPSTVDQHRSTVDQRSASASASSSSSGESAERGKRRPVLDDAEFMTELRKLYSWADVDVEIAKMKAWMLTPRGKGRELTRRFVVNWLNRLDKPINSATMTANAAQKLKVGEDSDPALHDYARQLWIAKRDRADRDVFGMIYRKVAQGFGEQWVEAVKAAALDLERAERGFVLT